MWQLPILIIIAFLGLLFNGLILFSIIKYKILRKKTYTFLVSLAVCDLTKVAVIINIIAYNKLHSFGDYCAQTSILGITLLCVTTFHLAGESVNRCLIVVWPYEYVRILKKKHVGIVLVLLWVLPVVFCVLTPILWFKAQWMDYLYFQSSIFGCVNPKFDKEIHENDDSKLYVILMHVMFFAIPLTVMSISYGVVLKTSYTVAQKMRTVEIAKKPTITSPVVKKSKFSSPIIEMVSATYGVSIISEDLSIKNKIEHRSTRAMSLANASKELKRQLKMRRREIKSSKTVLIMISAFVICNAPIFAIGWFTDLDKKTSDTLIKSFLTLAQFQVFVDPLVYFLRLKDFKEARKKCKHVSRTIIRKTIRRL